MALDLAQGGRASLSSHLIGQAVSHGHILLQGELGNVVFLGSVTRRGTQRRDLEANSAQTFPQRPRLLECGSGGLAWRRPGRGGSWQKPPENPRSELERGGWQDPKLVSITQSSLHCSPSQTSGGFQLSEFKMGFHHLAAKAWTACGAGGSAWS